MCASVPVRASAGVAPRASRDSAREGWRPCVAWLAHTCSLVKNRFNRGRRPTYAAAHERTGRHIRCPGCRRGPPPAHAGGVGLAPGTGRAAPAGRSGHLSSGPERGHPLPPAPPGKGPPRPAPHGSCGAPHGVRHPGPPDGRQPPPPPAAGLARPAHRRTPAHGPAPGRGLEVPGPTSAASRRAAGHRGRVGPPHPAHCRPRPRPVGMRPGPGRARGSRPGGCAPGRSPLPRRLAQLLGAALRGRAPAEPGPALRPPRRRQERRPA
jgi:hypothetical protein